MEKTSTKQQKIDRMINILKNWIMPVILGVISATASVVANYSSITLRLDSLTSTVDAQEDRIDIHQQTCSNQYQNLIQDNAAMNAKIDYIYDWVQDLRNN